MCLIMNNADLLRPAVREVRRLRETATLFTEVDKYRPPEFLLHAAIEELGEVMEAYENNASPEQISDEIRDSMVFPLSWYLLIAGNQQLPNSIESVNGFGRHSSAIELTRTQLRELAENPNPIRQMKDFYRILSQLCSIGLHSPEGEKVFSHFHLTIKKVLTNYSKAFFSKTQLAKQRVPEEAVLAFFEHLVRAMRIIRRALTKGERPLTKQDWMPHYHLIIDWQNSPAALAKLEQAVTERVDEVRESGIAVAGPETTRQIESSKETGRMPRETVVYQAGWRTLRPQ